MNFYDESVLTNSFNETEDSNNTIIGFADDPFMSLLPLLNESSAITVEATKALYKSIMETGDIHAAYANYFESAKARIKLFEKFSYKIFAECEKQVMIKSNDLNRAYGKLRGKKITIPCDIHIPNIAMDNVFRYPSVESLEEIVSFDNIVKNYLDKEQNAPDVYNSVVYALNNGGYDKMRGALLGYAPGITEAGLQDFCINLFHDSDTKYWIINSDESFVDWFTEVNDIIKKIREKTARDSKAVSNILKEAKKDIEELQYRNIDKDALAFEKYFSINKNVNTEFADNPEKINAIMRLKVDYLQEAFDTFMLAYCIKTDAIKHYIDSLIEICNYVYSTQMTATTIGGVE